MSMSAYRFLWSPITLWLTTTLFSTSLFTVSCLGDNQPRDFASCLTYHNINFTTYSDTNYNSLLFSSMYNLRFTDSSIPKPKAIIVPSSKEQLVNTLLCCKESSMEIRVRCGGHSYEGTSSVATYGSPFVIIEMKNLDKVLVDVEAQVTWIEGGATIGQAYLAIAQVTKDHTISAGTCPTVGVGGHISGGGIGHLSRKYGLAADNVVDALLINAEGQVLDREAMGEEVFWAIRGGGGGVWGIIFAWKIRLVTIPKVMTVFTATRLHLEHDITALFHKWQFIAPKLENGFSLVAYIGVGFMDTTGGNHLTITFKGTYLGPTEDVVSTLESVFSELGVTVEDCKEMSWPEAVLDAALLKNTTIYDLAKRSLDDKHYFKTKYDYVRTPIPISGIKATLDMLKKQSKAIILIEPLGGIIDEIASDSIPFPHRNGTIYGIQYEVQWKEEDNEKSKEYVEWVRNLYNTLTPYVSSDPRASYVNCMDLDLGEMRWHNDSHVDEVEMARVWGEKYFLRNYDRLVRAKTLIDPHNIFRNQQGIPPMHASITRNQLLVSEMK